MNPNIHMSGRKTDVRISASQNDISPEAAESTPNNTGAQQQA
jgi:hypothetical protein